MKAVILYHQNSEFTRSLEAYVRDFATQQNQTIELVSLETVKGADLARLYDIVQYPALLVMQDNGALVKDWQGSQMPLMSEVAGYLRS